MQPENKIRDYLAQNLHLIEEGLRLEKKEYRLPNPIGASGFIDILARDRLGMLVVVEIKKSDKSAREAIHELHKYVALLKINYGLEDYQFRCILVSTDWHELLVPFSSFVKTVNYHVEGLLLKLDNNGYPTNSSRVNLLPKTETRQLCPSHVIYLFDDSTPRRECIAIIDEAFSYLGIEHYCILEIDFATSEQIAYPYGVYLVMDVLDIAIQESIKKKIDIKIEESELELNRWIFEDSVFGNLTGEMVRITGDTEIGYPEKFVSILDKWNIKSIHRRGRFLSNEIMPDETLIGEISGTNGNNSFLFFALTKPAFSSHWQNCIDSMQYCLEGNDYWQKGVNSFLERVAGNQLDSSVAIHIYNPANTISSLYMSFKKMDYAYIPSLEIIVDDDGKRLVMLLGLIEWDKQVFPSNPTTIVNDIFEEEWDFIQAWMFGEVWEYDGQLMKAHGLKYTLVEVTLYPQSMPIGRYFYPSTTATAWATGSQEINEIIGITEFFQNNLQYLRSLRVFVDSRIHDSFDYL